MLKFMWFQILQWSLKGDSHLTKKIYFSLRGINVKKAEKENDL